MFPAEGFPSFPLLTLAKSGCQQAYVIPQGRMAPFRHVRALVGYRRDGNHPVLLTIPTKAYSQEQDIEHWSDAGPDMVGDLEEPVGGRSGVVPSSVRFHNQTNNEPWQ
jgi:hypothetical protein